MNYTFVGQQIRKYRRERGMTQARLAEAIDRSTSLVGHIERGTRVPSVDTLVAICKALRVSLDRLIIPQAEDWPFEGYEPKQIQAARELLELTLSMCGR